MRKMLIALFALTIGMGSVMADSNISLEDEKEEKKRKKGKDETLFDTFRRNASKAIGRPLKGTIGGSSENHLLTKEKIDENRKGAVDISTRANKLTKEEYRKIGKVALSLGLRVGNEGDHLHIDDNIKDKKGKTLNRVFTRKQGTKEDGAYFKSLKEEDMDTFENDPVIKAKSSMFDNRVLNNRSPHSIQDSVNIQDSSIKKEETMINKPLEEEEEEGKIDKARIKANTAFMEISKAGQELSEVQKRAFQKEQLNFDNQMATATETEQKKSNGEQVSAKDNFMQAITYFLPSIAGLAIGGAIGGEAGAAQGAQLGMKAGEGYRQSTLAREKFEYQKEKDVADRRARSVVTPKKQQSADWMTKDKKPVVFDPEEGVYKTTEGEVVPSGKLMSSKNYRQAINSEFRAAGLKQTQINQLASSQKTLFQQSAPAGLLRGRLMEVDKVENLIDSGAPFKGLLESAMAKGLGGEVGNLTDSERQAAAQIVGFKGQLANLSEYLTSNLSSLRTDKIKELLKFIKPRLKKRLGKVVSDYASTNANVLGMDEALVRDYYTKTAGVDIDFGKKSKSKVPTDKDIMNMNEEELDKWIKENK